MKINSSFLHLILIFNVLFWGCQKNSFDEKQVEGFNVKTYFNSEKNIEIVVIATSDGGQIVATPKSKISLKNQMGDEEYKCLKNCIPIDDFNKRWECILKCPITKQYNVALGFKQENIDKLNSEFKKQIIANAVLQKVEVDTSKIQKFIDTKTGSDVVIVPLLNGEVDSLDFASGVPIQFMQLKNKKDENSRIKSGYYVVKLQLINDDAHLIIVDKNNVTAYKSTSKMGDLENPPSFPFDIEPQALKICGESKCFEAKWKGGKIVWGCKDKKTGKVVTCL